MINNFSCQSQCEKDFFYLYLDISYWLSVIHPFCHSPYLPPGAVLSGRASLGRAWPASSSPPPVRQSRGRPWHQWSGTLGGLPTHGTIWHLRGPSGDSPSLVYTTASEKKTSRSDSAITGCVLLDHTGGRERSRVSLHRRWAMERTERERRPSRRPGPRRTLEPPSGRGSSRHAESRFCGDEHGRRVCQRGKIETGWKRGGSGASQPGAARQDGGVRRLHEDGFRHGTVHVEVGTQIPLNNVSGFDFDFGNLFSFGLVSLSFGFSLFSSCFPFHLISFPPHLLSHLSPPPPEVDGCHLCVLSLFQEPAMQITTSWIFMVDPRRGGKHRECEAWERNERRQISNWMVAPKMPLRCPLRGHRHAFPRNRWCVFLMRFYLKNRNYFRFAGWRWVFDPWSKLSMDLCIPSRHFTDFWDFCLTNNRFIIFHWLLFCSENIPAHDTLAGDSITITIYSYEVRTMERNL